MHRMRLWAHTLPCLISLLAFCAMTPAAAQTVAQGDRDAITRAALDYAEGWYEGSAEKMERALHPDLAKRITITREGRSRLEQMSAMTLVQSTRAGGGSKTPKERQQKDVMVFDIFGNAASARLTMDGWIDYMHLAKVNGQWKIVNVLWELKPAETKSP